MKSTEIIQIAFEQSGLSTKQASDLIGFKSRNHFSAIKSGAERLPKAKIFKTSEVLKIDKFELTKALMEDSEDTEDYDVLRIAYEYLHQPMMTQNEINIIQFIRRYSKDLNPNLLDNTKSPDRPSSEILKSTIKELGRRAIQLHEEALNKIKAKPKRGKQSCK